MTSFLIMVACSVFTAVLAAELVIHRMPSVLKGLTMTETSSQGPRGLTGDKGAKGDTRAPDSGDEAEDLAALLQVFTDFAAYDEDRKTAQTAVDNARIKEPYPSIDLQCEEGRQ